MMIILMGKSAVGKDTVQKELVSEGFERVVTATTRNMREGELNGRDYHFMKDEQFQRLINGNGFVEHTAFNGVQYGCPKTSVDLAKDQCIILEPEGARNFIGEFGRDNIFVVELCIDDEIRKQRAMARSPMSEEEWQKRCEADNERFDSKKMFMLVNYELELSEKSTPYMTAQNIIEAYEDYKQSNICKSDLYKRYGQADEKLLDRPFEK